ncbi:hypothetical protein CPC08DRAFT_784829 [Agrocybe pediades]|nr:hypothetical protein CPC08DRAFT_784829 [Agrocybe pediades]
MSDSAMVDSIPPPRYYEYMEAQQRVSVWIQNTGVGSSMKLTLESKGSAADCARIPRASRQSWEAEPLEQAPIPPAIALVTSSLVVCAFLPSLLTVSAFVVLLTLAATEDTPKENAAKKPRWSP